ncbi:unnamed protein product [Auanema sp. JU1783]|nr:unnamed protein product [Auanema sp. JU1783]
MSHFFVLSCVLALASASYIPPYYGGHDDHGDHHSRYGKLNGDGYGAQAGYGYGYDGSGYDKAAGHQGYYGDNYGNDGYADGHADYSKGAADGYDGAHHDEGARNAVDAEGMKKYSYFTSGSGPEGSYSKGYYGSEGYDHQNANSRHAADGSGAGYKKGYNAASADEADAQSRYGKGAASHNGYGNEYDASKYGYGYGKNDFGGHNNGWVNQAHSGAHASHGPYF